MKRKVSRFGEGVIGESEQLTNLSCPSQLRSVFQLWLPPTVSSGPIPIQDGKTQDSRCMQNPIPGSSHSYTVAGEISLHSQALP